MIVDVRMILELDAKPEIVDDEVRNLTEQAMAANFRAMRMEGIKVVDVTVHLRTEKEQQQLN